MTIPSYFSGNYSEARAKFLAVCEKRSLAVESFLNPKTKGAQGEDLYTDVARIGPADAAKVLTLSSGTHGVEGYCGSGVQVGLLEENAFADLPEDLSVVLIHAVNPYGFSHDRRVTEDNVDLNRNFVDFDTYVADDEGYAAIHPFILPADWDGPGREAADQSLFGFIAEHGLTAFQAAVSGGQYRHPDGVFFGGQKPTWSRETIIHILQSYAKQARLVGMIDFHTGLGPYGYGELITDGPPEMKALSKAWYGDEATDPAEGTSTSAVLTGTFGHGASEALPDAQIAFIALEYGTLDSQSVLQALRGDNWLYHRGAMNTDLSTTIKRDIRDAFYQDKDDWKEAIWTRANEVIGITLAKMKDAG